MNGGRRRSLAMAALVPPAALVLVCMTGPPGLARASALVALMAASHLLVAFVAALAWQVTGHWRLARHLSHDSVTAIVAGHSVHVIDGSGGPFVAGLLRPRIYLPDDALARLSSAEMRAVLAHEACHQRERAPAKLLVLSTLGCFLGRIPWVGGELERSRALLEIRADQHALDLGARRSTLASALLAVPADRSAMGVAAFETHGELRLRVLLGDVAATPRTAGLRWAAAGPAASLACLAFYLR